MRGEAKMRMAGSGVSGATYCRPRKSLPSESDLAFDFQKARRTARPDERTQQAGGRTHRGDTGTELRIRNIVHRLIEVRMIQQIVSVSAERKSNMLCNRDVLHQRKID